MYETCTSFDESQIGSEQNRSSRDASIRSAALILALTAVLIFPSLSSACHGAVVESASVVVPSPAVTDSIRLVCGHACIAPGLGAETALVAAGTDPVVRVEEDWELFVTEPDPDVAAPQVETVMSPFQNLDGFYIMFLLNHRSNPNLAVGGMELQFWFGDQLVGARKLDRDLLHHAEERIAWTQRLMIKGSEGSRYVCFRIVGGTSESWGGFGDDVLHMNLDTTQSDLSSYQSTFSVDNSGVTFSSHRVAQLTLKAVRGYSTAGELVFEETTPVVVYGGASQ
jgi:hypothetical protein